MKTIAFILSVYILALNFAPCEDSSITDNDIKDEVSQGGDSDHEHSGLDLCSPFCQCHCCHVHTIYSNLSDFEVNTNLISTNLFLHFDSFGKDIPNSILHPPQHT